jgi:hypothetical protein
MMSGRVAWGTVVEREAAWAVLQALITSLDEAPEFDSENVGGMIGIAVMRAQRRRDEAEDRSTAIPDGT